MEGEHGSVGQLVTFYRLLPMPGLILGVDICEAAISAVLAKGGRKVGQVVFQRRIALPQENDGDRERLLAEALGELASSLPAVPDAVCASIPSSVVSFRNIRVPFGNRQKIRKIVPFELEPSLATPVGDTAVDFLVADGDEGGGRRIVAAVVERAVLDGYIAVLSEAGLEPDFLGISGHATALSLNRYPDLPQQALALHADARTVTIHQLVSGKPVMVRAFRVPAAGPGRFKTVARNILRTMVAAEEQISEEFHPERVFVSGSGAELVQLREFLEQNLGMPATLATPRLFLAGKAISTAGKIASPQMANALALALRYGDREDDLNFRTGEFAVAGKWAEYGKAFARTGTLAALALVLFLSSMFYRNRVLEGRLEDLNRKIENIFVSTFPEVTRIVDPYQQMRIEVAGADPGGVSPGRVHRRERAIDVLREISAKIPPGADVEVDRMVVGNENIQFSGAAPSFKTVNQIQKDLETIPFLSKVVIASATQERSGNRIQFKISADFGEAEFGKANAGKDVHGG